MKSLEELELCDEELSLPNQESGLQPPPELSPGPVTEASPPALSRRVLRACPRFISRKQTSEVPPTATMNAVIPLVIVSAAPGFGRIRYLCTAICRSLPRFVTPKATAVH